MEATRGSEELELELPAVPESVTRARHAVAEVAKGVVAAEYNVALAVSEAVGNAVLHAYRDRKPGIIRLAARIRDGRLFVTVSDDGGGIRPRLDSKGLGVGMGLMQQAASELSLESTENGTSVRMVFAGEAQ